MYRFSEISLGASDCESNQATYLLATPNRADSYQHGRRNPMTAQPYPQSLREAKELLDYFYGFDRAEDPDRYSLATNFRDDAMRLIIFNFQLTIADLLRDLIYARLGNTRVFTAAQTKRYLSDLRDRDAIDLAARLKIVDRQLHFNLVELNRIRNAVAHNWTLDSYTVQKTGRTRRRRYRLEWEGTRLTPQRMRDEFIPLYGDIYLMLFGAYLDRKCIKRIR
jgi:hypothetical protein